MALINLWLRHHRESGSERVFKIGQLVSSAAVSLGHGTNDAQKTMGVIAVAGSVTGVGTVTRGVPVNWSVFGQMAIAWVVTIPAAALLAAGVYGVTQLDSPGAAAVLLGIFGAALLTVLTFGLRRTTRSARFDPERSPGAGQQVAAGS